ncbi:MAG TPA: YafY family protein [Solirubrobacteraceae bacterium]|nr:YafY family protein [Solirubrobacteraceae bacterium]
MADTASRMLELLSLLQARRDWPGNELADRLGVSGRTIRRDMERLRHLGYPVQSLSGPAGGYRLRAGAAMPPLLFDDEEAIAIAVGLLTAAHASVASIEETALRALVKVEQILPSHLRRRVRALGSMTVTLPVSGPTVEPHYLTVIAAACRDAECLRFTYRRRDRSETRREVEPHSLVNRGHRWYLVAWDRLRDDWRTFRIDRLTKPTSTGVRFEAHELPTNDAAAFVERSIAAAPNRFEAVLVLHAEAEQLARRLPIHWGAIKPIDAHTSEFRTGDDDLRWLALRIAMLGVDFEVREPPELADHVRALAARFDRAARLPGGGTVLRP